MCKWQIIANTLSLSHSLISSLIHSLIPSPPHSFTPSPMQLPQHLQETVGTLLAESQWTCTGKREKRVVYPPHSYSWLTLTCSPHLVSFINGKELDGEGTAATPQHILPPPLHLLLLLQRLIRLGRGGPCHTHCYTVLSHFLYTR